MRTSPLRIIIGALALGGLGAVASCAGPPPAAPPGARPSATAVAPAVPPSPTATPAPTGPVPPDHVVVAIFENRDYRQIKGEPTAPYLNALMARSANFTNARAETHPSQPNYLALFSGSTQGVTDNSCPLRLRGKPNLASQLIAAGLTFTGYAEGLPSPGFRGCSHGRYAAKHNPWVSFDNVPAKANQPFTAWPTDYNRLPTVAFVVPDLCNDAHDCDLATADRWAKRHLDPYLRWADTHNSRLILTFDENDGSEGNRIVTLIAGAGVRPGPRKERINHYTLLRTVEDWYGLEPLGNARSESPIRDLD